MTLLLYKNILFTVIIILCRRVICAQNADSLIKWERYDPAHLKESMRAFYKYNSYSYIAVPQVHESAGGDSDVGIFHIYVRKFSATPHPENHIWMISGGPGCSTSGVERALSVQLPNTAVYIMDTRGLGHSHK